MKPIPISTTEFIERVKNDEILILDFWASWCGPCRAFAPIFEAAAARHPDITWGKVDTEAEQELAAALDIRSIPTLMVFRQGVLLLAQAGLVPAAALDEIVARVRAIDMDDVRQRIEKARGEEASPRPD